MGNCFKCKTLSICKVIGFSSSSLKLRLIEPIPDAFNPNVIPDIVMLVNSLYIPSMKLFLCRVAVYEASLSIIAGTESVSKATFESLEEIAVNKA